MTENERRFSMRVKRNPTGLVCDISPEREDKLIKQQYTYRYGKK